MLPEPETATREGRIVNPFNSFDCDILDRAPDVANLLHPTGILDDDLKDMADLWMDLGGCD